MTPATTLKWDAQVAANRGARSKSTQCLYLACLTVNKTLPTRLRVVLEGSYMVGQNIVLRNIGSRGTAITPFVRLRDVKAATAEGGHWIGRSSRYPRRNQRSKQLILMDLANEKPN
jgi:hypothetical protein